MTSGAEPALARAPGRAEWLGNHTDYNDGLVLGIGLEVGATVVARTIAGRQLVLRAEDLGEEVACGLDALSPVEAGSWANYAIGVAAGFLARGAKGTGVELSIRSTVPMGAGLSSSAALECATATTDRLIVKTDPDRRRKWTCRPTSRPPSSSSRRRGPNSNPSNISSQTARRRLECRLSWWLATSSAPEKTPCLLNGRSRTYHNSGLSAAFRSACPGIRAAHPVGAGARFCHAHHHAP